MFLKCAIHSAHKGFWFSVPFKDVSKGFCKQYESSFTLWQFDIWSTFVLFFMFCICISFEMYWLTSTTGSRQGFRCGWIWGSKVSQDPGAQCSSALVQVMVSGVRPLRVEQVMRVEPTTSCIKLLQGYFPMLLWWKGPGQIAQMPMWALGRSSKRREDAGAVGHGLASSTLRSSAHVISDSGPSSRMLRV